MPNLDYEIEVWQKGYEIVAGVDEVGRGCFAGPVVAGCVAFRQIPSSKSQATNGIRIDDSKKLTARQREMADSWIRENAISFGIGEASVSQINKFGIKKATEIAMRRAIVKCNLKVDYLLIDAFYIPHVSGLGRKSQMAIVKGDTKSVSIAAASIIAKVYRDEKMIQNSRIPEHQMYGWEKNKGYGTKKHRMAIQQYGISNLHRTQFVKNYVSSQV